MSWRGLLCFLVLTTGCGFGDDEGATPARGKVASGSPRYVVGTLSATAAAATAPAADDYGNEAGEAKTLSVDEPVTGRLEQPSDTDWFAVELRAGERYRVGLDAYGAVRVVVIDPDGVELSQGLASDELIVTAARDGKHFFRVEAQAGRDLFYGFEVAAQP